MEKKTGVSLSSLNAVKASDTAFEFEYITPDGENSGVFLSVLGSQSDVVSKAAAKMINERRKKQAAREVGKRLNQKNVDFDTLEDDVAFGQRLAASRLVGWRGIDDPFTPENALVLCQTNSFIASQIMEQSNDLGNFMKL